MTFVVLLKCYDYENAVSYDLLTVKYPQNLRKLENEILPDTFLQASKMKYEPKFLEKIGYAWCVLPSFDCIRIYVEE